MKIENLWKVIPAEERDKDSNKEQVSLEDISEKQRQFYIEKLQSPYIKSFFTLIKDTPHFWDQALKRYARREDFINIAQDLEATNDKISGVFDQDHIKRLVPLWSTACTVPELRSYLQISLDAAACEESTSIKSKMEEETQYVEELVVGAGVHSAAYNVEFMHYAPTIPRLSVESASELGGQFRQYGGPAFRMNTPNRPINIDDPKALDNPNMNSFGPHAPLQLSDISGDLYADNEKIGIAAAVNQYLSAKTLLETSVTSVKLNTNENSLGKYKVELIDTKTGKVSEVNTDRVIVSTGLGKAEHGFSQFDKQTKELCNANDGRVITYTDFLEEVGDRSNPFPLERFANKCVVIVGGGHSALTVAEHLTGIGPEYRGSTAALGYPSKVVIVGAKFENGKEFIEGEIPRYTQLASAIQKRGVPGEEAKAHLIKPVVGMRATSLKEKQYTDDDGKIIKSRIIVVCKSKAADSGAPAMEEIEADIIITTTGFDNNGYKKIFADFIDNTEETPEFDDVRVEGVPHPVAKYLHGNKDIIFVGPAAKMPTSQRSLSMAQIYNRPTNPVAIPSTVDDTRACARYLASLSENKGNAEKFPGFGVKTEKKKIKLFEEGKNKREEAVSIVHIPLEVASREFPSEVHYEELLRLAVKGHTNKYLVDKVPPLTILVSREGKEEGANGDVSLRVTSSAALSADGEMFVKDFFKDPISQAAVAKLTERRRGANKPVEITFTP